MRGRKPTHGHAPRGNFSKTYMVWQSMMRRCYNSASPYFGDYGGRGIIVCERWHKFQNFLSDMGEVPSSDIKLTLDRKNNNGNYSPDNCRWVPYKTQARNRRSNSVVVINGEKKCIAEWLEIYGLKRCTFRGRQKLGWDNISALTTPVKEQYHAKSDTESKSF